ncbi:MAG: hypothetical protein M3P51_10115, partial [Chloroflexota bacterium]|nr:hypothetical protein [Chloroflexota bacterium]
MPNSLICRYCKLIAYSSTVAGRSSGAMMGEKTFTPKRVYELDWEHRIPPDHLLRRVAEVVDFSFVRRLTARYYS